MSAELATPSKTLQRLQARTIESIHPGDGSINWEPVRHAYITTDVTLHELAQDGLAGEATVQNAIKELGIDPDKPNPITT